MKVIGLTGGISSGKSTASEILRQLGAYIIDADLIAREILAKDGCVIDRLVETFGLSIVDDNGNIIRSKLADKVFGDARGLRMLNDIAHPVIIDEIIRQINNIKGDPHAFPAIIVDAALLIESGLYRYVDQVWLIKIDRNKQIERLMARDDISKQQAVDRVNSQMSYEEKERFVHHIIDNNGDLSSIRRQIQYLWKVDILGGI